MQSVDGVGNPHPQKIFNVDPLGQGRLRAI